MFGSISRTNTFICAVLRWCHLQSGSNMNSRLLSCALPWKRLHQMGREKSEWGHRERRRRKRRVRQYLCLTDEHRGRKKIIVERKAEKNQCSKKENEGQTKIAHSREKKYECKAIMMKGGEIRGTGRLRDTTNVLAQPCPLKLKTTCLVERCGGRSLSYQGKPRQEYCCQQLCLAEKCCRDSRSSAVTTICIYFEHWVPLWKLNIYNAVKGLVWEGETVTSKTWPQLGQLHTRTHTGLSHAPYSSMASTHLHIYLCISVTAAMPVTCKHAVNAHNNTCTKFSVLRCTAWHSHTQINTRVQSVAKAWQQDGSAKPNPCYCQL